MSSHYFIGIPVEEEVKEHLIEWQDELKQHMNYQVWTEKEDFHITLKFLGACSDDKVEMFISRLQDIHHVSPFSLVLGPAGSFGDRKQPRVFFASVSDTSAIHILKQEVEEVASKLGWAKEKRAYRPHVTIAKKRAQGTSPLIGGDIPIFQHSLEQRVTKFHLYKIHPQQKPKYEIIATFSLGKEE
ncbi:RNA 2',3'-cyclic phosphodiesterase [Halobacillus salinus]|uniref:RNA 2',3'-cyclic phosphodiesterase n=1 Tax=Halobacillus salinus TaxID=192814 RepID=A0A4Z0GT31_9BACI|nr:RNA 2',3'-cyclic phosphodiesterase [Halobacillus salinus]TGB00697.1 RNA 2',3'-cyclic phosphodiesterase [Halobacillus salinus]